MEYRSSAGHAVLVVTAVMFMLVLTAAILAATISDQLKAVRQTARADELSGLLRRSAFEEEARVLIAKAQQAKGRALSMVIADIDHFKRINDQWGHPAGDAAIRAFGEIIAGTIRPADLAGRIGGEEFCIFAWDCPAQAAGQLADRLRCALEQQAPAQLWAAGALTASFGVAQLQPGDSYEAIYGRADEALYRAKTQGRNQVIVAGDEAVLAQAAPIAIPVVAAVPLRSGKAARAGAADRAAGLERKAAIARGA